MVYLFGEAQSSHRLFFVAQIRSDLEGQGPRVQLAGMSSHPPPVVTSDDVKTLGP